MSCACFLIPEKAPKNKVCSAGEVQVSFGIKAYKVCVIISLYNCRGNDVNTMLTMRGVYVVV